MQKIFLAIAVIICLQAAPSAADWRMEVTYEYYPVKPRSGVSLYKQLYNDTPLVLEDGRVFLADIGWDIKREAKTTSHIFGRFPHGCVVDSYDIISECRITLPELDSNDQELLEAFNAFRPHLQEEQLQHCRLVSDYAARISRELKYDDLCNEHSERFETLYAELLPSILNDQIKLDRRQTELRITRFDPAKFYLGEVYPEEENLGHGDNPEPDSVINNMPPPPRLVESLKSLEEGLPEGFYKDKDGFWRSRSHSEPTPAAP